MPESLIVALPTNNIFPAKLRGRYNMKFLRESKSKSIYDDFFHDTISEPETLG